MCKVLHLANRKIRTQRTSTVELLRLINLPTVGDRNLFKIWIGIDGECVFRERKHLAIPNGVAKRAIGRRIEHGSNRLHLAWAAGNPHQTVGDDSVLDSRFGREDT